MIKLPSTHCICNELEVFAGDSLHGCTCFPTREKCSTSKILGNMVITPHACARGKVIGSVIVVVVVVVVNKNIARSRHLGTLATRKHGKSVEYGEKLALLCFESSSTAYKRHK